MKVIMKKECCSCTKRSTTGTRSIKLAVLFSELTLITRLMSSSSLREMYKNSCSYLRPLLILYYSQFRIFCPLPTKDQVFLYVRAQDAQLKGSHPYALPERYADVKKRILSSVPFLTNGAANSVIRSIQDVDVRTLEDLVKELLYIALDLEDIGSYCTLKMTTLLHNYNHNELLLDVRRATVDLLKAQMMGIACAGVTMSGERLSIGFILKNRIKCDKISLSLGLQSSRLRNLFLLNICSHNFLSFCARSDRILFLCEYTCDLERKKKEGVNKCTAQNKQELEIHLKQNRELCNEKVLLYCLMRGC